MSRSLNKAILFLATVRKRKGSIDVEAAGCGKGRGRKADGAHVDDGGGADETEATDAGAGREQKEVCPARKASMSLGDVLAERYETAEGESELEHYQRESKMLQRLTSYL